MLIFLRRSVMSEKLPNLYLKWRVFREMIGDERKDAEIAATIFGPEGASIKFTRILYGDQGISTAIAAQLADTINRCVRVYRQERSLPAECNIVLTPNDLGLPLYEFARRLVDAADGKIAPHVLERVHKGILAEMATAPAQTGPRLKIERFGPDRMFPVTEPSGGSGPVKFEAGRDQGSFLLEELPRRPSNAYLMIVRDPAPQHLWNLSWGETVLWIKSPFKPKYGQRSSVLMDPQPVLPVPGRFIVTAVALFDPELVGELDPRGAEPEPAALNELETARFLTNLRRLEKKTENLVITTAEYVTVVI
jgi:hypothetical protein